MEQKPYSHILQKKGILRAFTVAKVVKTKEIEALKALIREVSDSEEEYKILLNEEMKKISDMHNSNDPIPGIIYSGNGIEKRDIIQKLSQTVLKLTKTQNLSKKEMAFLITVIITNLGLTQDDFIKLSEDINNKSDDEEEDVDEDEDED